MKELEKKLQAVLDAAVANHENAGANVLVIQNGHELVYAQSGYANIEQQKPIQRDHIFRLYSQSKPVTAVAVALLVERGVIDVMQSVSEFMPSWKNQQVITKDGLVLAEREVTIYDLLSMTAGCCYPGDDAAGQAAAKLFDENQKAINAGKGLSTVEFISEIGKLPLAFQPGSAYRYSTCADVLGAVVEIASGMPYADFLEKEIFQPLGMKDTGFWVPAEKQDRFVTTYTRVPGGMVPWTSTHLDVGIYDRNPAFASGGAGLVSTVDDYKKFAGMLLGGGEYDGVRILKPATVDWLNKPQVMDPPWNGLQGFGYGKLMRVCIDPGKYPGLAVKGEYGWDGWLGTYMAIIPALNMTIQSFQNTTDMGTGSMVRKLRNVLLSNL